MTATARQSTSLPWWIEETSIAPERKGLSIADIKRMVPISKLLLHYGMPEKYDRYSDEWQTVPCPFHDDSRPSASMNTRLKRFRCHTCDMGGDVVGIVQEVEGFSKTREAMEWLRQTFAL